jgi:hypothetical protein
MKSKIFLCLVAILLVMPMGFSLEFNEIDHTRAEESEITVIITRCGNSDTEFSEYTLNFISMLEDKEYNYDLAFYGDWGDSCKISSFDYVSSVEPEIYVIYREMSDNYVVDLCDYDGDVTKGIDYSMFLSKIGDLNGYELGSYCLDEIIDQIPKNVWLFPRISQEDVEPVSSSSTVTVQGGVGGKDIFGDCTCSDIESDLDDSDINSILNDDDF